MIGSVAATKGSTMEKQMNREIANLIENAERNLIENAERNLSCEEMDSDDLDGDLNLSDDDSGRGARQ